MQFLRPTEPTRAAAPHAHQNAWRAGGVMALCLVLFACSQDPPTEGQNAVVGGNQHRGMELIGHYGCGTCHQIPGIADADGLVGPPLNRIGSRIYIAGVRRNTPESMIAWLENPQAIVPGNAMPDMGIGRQDATDIAAYLSTLR